jgi:RNA-directed DNA polymerase
MRSFNVDQQLKDPEVIRAAIIKTCKSKRKKATGSNRKWMQAQRILANLDTYVARTLQIVSAFEAAQKAEELGQGVAPEVATLAYSPKQCQPFTITDGGSRKVREITSVPLFPDQVIHQLLILVGQPVFMRGMYHYSCGSIPGRGVHKGKQYIARIINHHSKHDKSAIKYGVQLDITKCYPSIAHDYLKGQLRKKFRGKLYYWLCGAVIDSYYDSELGGQRFGLPIGYSTSQWFCNFALTPLDHFIKERLGVQHYVRYMDDMVFFGRNKKALHAAVRAIMEFVSGMGLRLKGNWQVFRFDYIDREGKHRGRALDFLGFRFFRDKIILRKRLALTIRRAVQRVSRVGKKVTPHAAMSLMSRLGWLRHCNSLRFYQRYIKPFVDIRKLKEVIRRESRKHSHAGCAV